MSVTFYANSIQKAGFDAVNEPTLSGETYTNSGGETTGPLYDLLDNRRTNVVTMDSLSQTNIMTVRIDLTTSITCTALIIDNHNLKTAACICDFEQGAVDVSIISSHSGTLGTALTDDSPGATFVPSADGVTLMTFTSAADTRWDLQINDVSAYDADVTIGEILLSAEFAPAHNPEYGSDLDYRMDGSEFTESDGGQRYGFSTHSNDRRAWRLTWKFMSDSDMSNLEDIFFFTRGSKFPFYIDLQDIEGNSTPTLYYVRFMRPLRFKQLTKDAWQVTVDIEEEI